MADRLPERKDASYLAGILRESVVLDCADPSRLVELVGDFGAGDGLSVGARMTSENELLVCGNFVAISGAQ
jgi:hypothetical protein